MAGIRTIGLLGGMSAEATAEYYRLINAGVNQRQGGWQTAELMICSVNFANIEAFVRGERDYSGLHRDGGQKEDWQPSTQI